MKRLKQEKYSGDFSEEFVLRGEVSDPLSVKVSSKKSHFLVWSHKKIRLYFMVSCSTHTFSRSFDSDDIETIIEILASAESLAKQLINQL